jgi:DMSO/TMAO reductase YedYZ molybdopterin-dependent catalytic subunit
MCISNEVGGDLIGNAHWRGVKLGWLLEQAGVRPEATRAMFTAADNYKDGVHIERALHPDALLAWEMNGEPLRREHGFPARLLIPGIYGMENVKWLTGITLAQDDSKGYWQVRGWDEQPSYRTMSRIDVPRARTTLPAGPIDVAGVTFAGDRGVRQVQVSTDGGQSWREAELKPGLSPYTWQLWRARVEPQPGIRDIRVRATDGAGQLQVAAEAPPFPSGATGNHTVSIFIAG